jgi:threonine dehydratase/cystathionine beta-lyase/cystathionine gamma-synthase
MIRMSMNPVLAPEQKSLDDIDPFAAAKELRGVAVRTAVRRLPWLERLVGVEVWAKLELQQHTGSFKYRGAHLAVSRAPGMPVIAASAGNHGLAVAEVARRLGREVNICVPVVASRLKREHILATGAGLIEYGNSLEEATAYARQLAAERDLYFISPYNNVDVVAGASTVALEFLEDVPGLETLIAPVGGGGLVSGLGLGAEAAGHPLRLVGCEPERYASLSSSLAAGEIVRVLNQPTLADGLAVNLEADSLTYPLARRLVDSMVTLSEEELAAATYALLVHESLLVEPAGAAAVIACLRLAERGELTGPVGLPLCGGNLQHGVLSRIQRFPYSQPDLMRLLDLRGRRVSDSPVAFARPIGRTAAGADLAPDAASDPGTDLDRQLQQCADDLTAAVHTVDEYRSYCETRQLQLDQEAVDRLLDSVEHALARIADARTGLAAVGDDDPADRLAVAETVLRSGLAALSYVRGSLEWCSPSYAQSRAVQFFNTGSQDSPTVNYERYESVAAQRVESQLLEVLGLPTDRYGLSVASSGMAAYSLVESFLVRNRLRSGDTVLLAPYIYFEASEQLTALPFVSVERARGYGTEDLLADVHALRPRCLFIDPVANTAPQRMVDVCGVLDRLRAEVDWPLTVVVDGTMVSGALPPERLVGSGSVEVLYYESCSKYLQLGLDAGMAGLVAYPVELRPHFERLRRNTGTILYRHQADLFPKFDRSLFHRRMRRISENALRVASVLQADPLVRLAGEVYYPGLDGHPDAQVARGLPYAGGCVTFLFHEPGRNHRDELEPLLERMLADARSVGLHLTKGVSFGFSAPRVSAAASMAETEPPFLRLYVGDRGHEQVELLAAVVARALAD